MRKILFGTIFLSTILSLSQPGNAQTADALVVKGDKAFERQDYDAALNYYLSAAKLGSAWAMNGLGAIYGEQKNDPRRALLWCTVAGTFGHAMNFGCIMKNEGKLSQDEVSRIKQLAIQCLASNFRACERLDPNQSANITAYYDKKCVVADPTGTPLNLRASPGGKIVGSLQNGYRYTVIDQSKDNQGREWSFLESEESNYGLGWVFKKFLKCGIRDAGMIREEGETASQNEDAQPQVVDLAPTYNENGAMGNENACRVTGQPGAARNFRTSPNGRIIGNLEGDGPYNVIDKTKDNQGREWSFLTNEHGNISLGWVFSTVVMCGATGGGVPGQAPTLKKNVENGPPRIVDVIATSKNSPYNETVDMGFDGNPNTKYLNFDKLNAGFIVTLNKAATLGSIQFTTANDFVGRDPTSITIHGSHDGLNWTSIVENLPISLPNNRKQSGSPIMIGARNSFEYYKVLFPTVKNMNRTCGLDCNSVQIADVVMTLN